MQTLQSYVLAISAPAHPVWARKLHAYKHGLWATAKPTGEVLGKRYYGKVKLKI